MKRLAMLVLVLVLSLPALAQDDMSEDAPTFIDEFNIPFGTTFDVTFVGGLSSLDYVPTEDMYYAISDDRIESGPARFYTLGIDLSADAINDVTLLDVVEIRRPDGTSYGELGADPEAMRYRAESDTLIWAHERDENGVPFVGEMNTDGTHVRAFTLPDYYIPDEAGTQGAASNVAFEALTLSPDGTQVIAGMENALIQDGPIASLETGSSARILVFDYETAEPVAEYVYEVGPVPYPPTEEGAFVTNGLVELLARPDGTFWAIERAFAVGVGHSAEFYIVDFNGATDVLNETSIADVDYTPVTKTLVFSLELVDNIEGITFGPEIDGQRTLIINSDDNFNPSQTSQFLAYTLGE